MGRLWGDGIKLNLVLGVRMAVHESCQGVSVAARDTQFRPIVRLKTNSNRRKNFQYVSALYISYLQVPPSDMCRCMRAERQKYDVMNERTDLKGWRAFTRHIRGHLLTQLLARVIS
jgi:hypothetical protein